MKDMKGMKINLGGCQMMRQLAEDGAKTLEIQVHRLRRRFDTPPAER